MKTIHLERIRRAAAGLALLLCILAPGFSHAEKWLRADTAHFIVYSDTSPSKARAYAAMLEDFDTLLRTIYGRKLDEPVPRKLDVYLVADLMQMRRIDPTTSPGVDGFYYMGEDDIFAAAIYGSVYSQADQTKGDDTTLHEYFHHFMMQYYPSAYPAWMAEGFAEYYATADMAAGMVTIGAVHPLRAKTLVLLDWLPIRLVLSKSVEQTPEKSWGAYYAESWLLTHYLLSDEQRSRKLGDYVTAIRAHRDPVVAWKEVFGEDTTALDEKLKAYRDLPLLERAVPRTWPEPVVAVYQLSQGAGEILLENQQTKLGWTNDATHKDLLALLRRSQKKYPNDPFVQLAAARAEIKFGDAKKAGADLEKFVSTHPNDAEALMLLGVDKLAAARADPSKRDEYFDAASKVFVRSINLDPERYQSLSRYAESRSIETAYPSEQTLDVLLRAVSLAPQLPALRIEAARIAITRNEMALARNLLVAVVGTPHGGEAAKIGGKMLDEIDRRAAQAAQLPATATPAH